VYVRCSTYSQAGISCRSPRSDIKTKTYRLIAHRPLQQAVSKKVPRETWKRIAIAITYQQSSIILSLNRAAITLSVSDQVIATDHEGILFKHHGGSSRRKSEQIYTSTKNVHSGKEKTGKPDSSLARDTVEAPAHRVMRQSHLIRRAHAKRIKHTSKKKNLVDKAFWPLALDAPFRALGQTRHQEPAKFQPHRAGSLGKRALA
jgi:hypothetical protein